VPYAASTVNETSPRFEVCRYCKNRPAVDGAFVFPLVPPQQGKHWGFTLLCLGHGFLAVRRGGRYISWRPQPGERAIGNVEAELREHRSVMTSAAHTVYAGARAELRRQGNARPTNAEIVSEAIEAAEVLGL
jgi:hypothetical protein